MAAHSSLRRAAVGRAVATLREDAKFPPPQCDLQAQGMLPLPPFTPPLSTTRRHLLQALALSPLALPQASGAQTSPDAEMLRKLFPAQVQGACTEQPMQLNGAGVRYRAMFRMYAAALYLEQPARTSQEVEQMQGCKRIALTMLRTVQATELGNLFTQGIHANIGTTQAQALLHNMLRMGEVFARFRTLHPGQLVTMDRVPGKGMALAVDGQTQPEPFDTAFFHALARIWLGEKPADVHLKAALLGLAPAR